MNDNIVWDNNAATYESEIFNVFQSDKKGIIKEYLNKHANKNAFAIDFGCGIGNALSLLSPRFKNILAVDISQKCIDKANDLGFDNVRFQKIDLAQNSVNLPEADFLICCNVAISGNNQRNYRILRNAMSCVKKGGTALFVVPSFESMSLSTWKLVDWYHRENVSIGDIPKSELQHIDAKFEKNLQKGIVNIQDAPTKHYRFPEFFSIFNSDEWKIESIEKVEYDWDTELESPPKWIRDPYPWDWLVEVKRK